MLPQPLPAPVAGAHAHGRRARERYIQARQHAVLLPPLPAPVAGGMHCTRSRTLDPRMRGLCLGTSFLSMPGCRPHSRVLPTTPTHTLQDRSRRACSRVQCPSTSARNAPVAAARAHRRSPRSRQACSRARRPSTLARSAPAVTLHGHLRAGGTHYTRSRTLHPCARGLCLGTSFSSMPDHRPHSRVLPITHTHTLTSNICPSRRTRRQTTTSLACASPCWTLHSPASTST